MSIGSALRTELNDDAGITAIVGTQVTLGQADQRWSLPYVLIHRIGNEHAHHMGGGGGLAEPTFQITCWESTPFLAEALATAVRGAIDAFRGTMGSGGNTAAVRMCHLGGETDLHDSQDGDNIGAYGVAMTFDMAHTETVPS